MDDEKYRRLKASMPWTEQVFTNGRSTLIKIINNRGEEVPLFDMTAFLTMITAKIASTTKTD